MTVDPKRYEVLTTLMHRESVLKADDAFAMLYPGLDPRSSSETETLWENEYDAFMDELLVKYRVN